MEKFLIRGKVNFTAIQLLLFLVFGLFLFFVSYLEDYPVGGIKLGIFWKALVLFFLFFGVFFNKKSSFDFLFLLGMLCFVKLLFYVYVDISYWIVDFSEAMKFLVIPLGISYFSHKSDNPIFAKKFLIFIGYWVPLSCIPFLFGLEPNREIDAFSLSIYGQDDANAFIGVFANAHVAAVTLAATSLLLIHIVRNDWVSKWVGLFLFAICLYSLYLTYARTGWFGFLLGTVIYSLFAFPRNKLFFYGLIFIPLAIVVAWVGYLSSDIFRMRLTGTNMYTTEVSVNQLGSGRLLFWSVALDGPATEGIPGILLGLGLEQSKDHMESTIGWRIFSHNGFLDAYQNSGLIGFGLFVSYLVGLGLLLWKERHRGGWFAFSFFSMFIFIQFIQGGSFWWLSLIFAATFSFIGGYGYVKK